jgi:hypothetical protein
LLNAFVYNNLNIFKIHIMPDSAQFRAIVALLYHSGGAQKNE